MVLSRQDKGQFSDRHIGPRESDVLEMLQSLGLASLDELVDQTIPKSIRMDKELDLPRGYSEAELLAYIAQVSSENDIYRSYIGTGYYDTVVPPVILRNVMENPGWYTAYTPYQAEISQGRLEALLNFQTMVIDLTGLEIANASLLDEGTAAAEAMTMLYGGVGSDERSYFFVSSNCHPQTIQVVRGRAVPLDITVVVGTDEDFLGRQDKESFFGTLVQYPGTNGLITDYTQFCDIAHGSGAFVVMAADLLALTLLTPPGEMGVDVAVGSTQRFGVPMGYGGPHAAFFATRERFKRKIPGRIIGVSRDQEGKPALRMALQTREQHIRRGKATSNICTAQVLLAVMAGMYAVYHGPEGLARIAKRIHRLARSVAQALREMGYDVIHDLFFDTLQIRVGEESVEEILAQSRRKKINLRNYGDGVFGMSLDETTSHNDVEELISIFDLSNDTAVLDLGRVGLDSPPDRDFPEGLRRTSDFLQHPVFHNYHSESEMLRYLNKLESKDLSLTTSMIPLGSCTMKLNATTEMVPVTWNAFGKLHPFAPLDQTGGYQRIFSDLEKWLSEISGLDHTSLQPNSGAQGEYAGLLVIRAFHESVGESHRNVCLIPTSAHGTNPASAVLAGMQIVPVECDESGNIDLEDLRDKAASHGDNLAALMVTYPSTHGVFEAAITDICDAIHQYGGRVYLDGANLNAQVGLCRPGDYGADVCHINLHKTFSIPHGGGGPGMGPICVTPELAPFLPGHPQVDCGGEEAICPVSGGPWGSASILVISWAYIALLGRTGVKKATQVAILNANYMENRLREQFGVLYRGDMGRVAHEFIIDLREFKKTADISAEDVAKRLIDYGFHAPTVSFPVAGTVMIEPTESESKEELDRFCEALLLIREEIRDIESEKADRMNNVLKNSPHTAASVSSSDWSCDYSREQAAYPASWTREYKYWVPVRRIDNVQGDRNLVCVCPPLESYLD
ncbi:MAG: glycine dehydrogenase (aminomethyl-transferring) [Gemmatimonadetes bacterium]|nr:glycine dehydrogenase (aminomethyl-transferring) [Gemmatimonadota bacterium]